jgi:hypothetical protein
LKNISSISLGVTGSRDKFSDLSAAFVSSNTLFAVINKLERLRSELREPNSPRAIEVAIELKMAHVREHDTVSQGAMRRFRQGVIEDCRKLAHEAVTNSYVLAFSHGPGPDEAGARSILDAGTGELSCSTIDVRLLLATPSVTYLRGRWLTPERIRNARLIG